MNNYFRETIILKKKNSSSADTEDFFRYANPKQTQPTQVTDQNQWTIQQCDSEILSDIETPAKSRMADSIIKEFELENSANVGSNNKQSRPNIDVINEALSSKYRLRGENETLLFIMIGTYIINISLHLEHMLSPRQHDYKKYIGLLVDFITSLYYIYDSYYKVKKMESDFHINIILHLLSGPVQLFLNVAYFMQFHQFCWFSIILKSLKLFATNFQKQNLSDIYNTFVNSLPLIFTSIVIYFVFTYLCTILYCDVNRHYFKNIGVSAFTLLQILTIDGWGDITKQLLPKTGISVIVLIFSFITILAMFFWFLIQAFQIDVMILDELVKQGKVDIDEQSISRRSQNLLPQKYYSIIFGKQQSRIVLLVWIIQLFYANMQNKLNSINDFHYICFHIFVSLIYTLHWIAVIVLKDIEAYNSYYSNIQLTFHVLSGPIAFCYSLLELITTQQIKYSPILIMFKILTNPSIRDISYIAIRVLSSSLSPYILMLILTLIVMGIIKSSYHSFESINLLDTLLIYLQTLTLDDWDGSLSKGFVQKGHFFAAFIIMFYILVCQFLLIPAFMAQACEIFQQILGISFKPRLNQDGDLNLYQYTDTNVETIVKRQSPRVFKINQSRNLIYLLLKYQRALFSYENTIHRKLLISLYGYLTNIGNLHFPKFSQLTKSEQSILKTTKSSKVIIEFKNQSIEVDSNQIQFVYLP
ncbi:unnamed protein product [Paramecium pentaurelia]|uniref:Ion transport domain-containing protein n=1 Tax=Paramecium pentaurelia TaxID=43138 RepID=A0A8S1U2Q4_9CILI|nr:unnamed protein product [Paramecium pentaurelia]